MRAKSFEGMVCPIAGALEAIGDRWALLILRDLTFGLNRYEDLRKSTSVSNAMLSDRLKQLESEGLIERRLYQHAPDRYEYHLTPKGKHVQVLLPVLAELGEKWGVSGASAPPLEFVTQGSEAPIKWVPVDAGTGEQVADSDIAVRSGPGADELMRWRLSRGGRVLKKD